MGIQWANNKPWKSFIWVLTVIRFIKARMGYGWDVRSELGENPLKVYRLQIVSILQKKMYSNLRDEE